MIKDVESGIMNSVSNDYEQELLLLESNQSTIIQKVIEQKEQEIQNQKRLS